MIAAVRSTLLLTLLIAASGCGLWRQTAEPVVMSATAIIKNREGAEIGRATLLTVTSGVQISGSLAGVGGGTHAIHVHTLGSCSPDFGAAGAHWNPDGKQHGLRNPLGPHGGDMPNLAVPANGSVTFDIIVPNATLRGGSRAMLDADGASLVVHAFADDYFTDPSGNSGDRIACGVIVAG
jgi:superoxide dismutase, Cu-Zn family